MRVITNNHPRPIIDAWDLTPAEREEFDYLDWPAIDDGRDGASFVRYRGRLYDLGEFERTHYHDEPVGSWDGIAVDSFFSGVVIRLVDDDYVVVGLALA